MRIKMLQRVGDHEKDAIVPVEDAVGKRYIAAGFAEEAPAEDPTEKFLAIMQKQNADLAAQAAVNAYALYEAKGFDPKHPARVNISAEQSPEDKRKGFAEHLRLITVAQCSHLFPGKQQEANETLDKVYGSTCASTPNGSRRKDLAEDSGTTGGYTVAPTYGQELFKLAAEQSIVRPYSNNKKLPGREAYYPMLNQTAVPAGTQDSPQSAIWGGVQMTWLGESVAGTSTEPNFKQIHVVTNELQGLTGVSRFLLNDSFLAMDAELRQLFSGAIAWAEDYAFLQGNGNNKPIGILNAAATITYGTRATANTFKLADAANMAGAMMPQSRMKMVWIATNTMFAPLVQLLDSSGRVTYVNNVGSGYGDAKLMQGQTGLLLLGRPVIFTEKLPALGTAGDIIAADLSKYITADTGTLEIAASDQYAFNKNQITYRVIERVDGQPQVDAPYTQPDGTTQLSPFVLLHA